MKILVRVGLLLLSAFLMSTSCDDDDPGTNNSRQGIAMAWEIASVGGEIPNSLDFTQFVLDIKADDASAAQPETGTYTINGALQIPRPDYNNVGSSQGNWRYDYTANILYLYPSSVDPGTPNATPVSVVTVTNLTEDSFTATWTVPDPDADNPGGDKTNPTYTIDFVAAAMQ